MRNGNVILLLSKMRKKSALFDLNEIEVKKNGDIQKAKNEKEFAGNVLIQKR